MRPASARLWPGGQRPAGLAGRTGGGFDMGRAQHGHGGGLDRQTVLWRGEVHVCTATEQFEQAWRKG